MLNSRNKKLAILTAVAISILILGLLQNIKVAYAQTYEETIEIPQNFTFEEFSENEGTMKNITSIDIDLGSSRWNVTHIELNFTEMVFGNETKIVEDIPDNREEIDKKTHALGVQIKITDPTIIYGLYIYIKNLSAPPLDIYIQIREYNDADNTPGDKIHSSVLMNTIYNDENWYKHMFAKSVSLEPGSYYLVLNGTNIALGNSVYAWYNSFENRKNPDLYTSVYERLVGSWSIGKTGSPFLYKLIQKINSTFYPNEMNMNATIDGIDHSIVNGPSPGSGSLSLPDENFFPNSTILNIAVENNKSEALLFNLSYYINLNNSFLTDGSCTINTNSKIQWNIDFNLNRSNGNYTAKFLYPNSWTNFIVLKNDERLIHGEDYINNTVEKTIYILNDTIPYENVPWKITAESLRIPFNFNGPDPVITAGTESISGVPFPLNGTYTYLLYVGEYEKYRNSTSYNGEPLPGDILSFSHVIPDTGPNGDWIAIIYWNNGTDAGVETAAFTVSGGITVISGAGGGGGGGGGTTTVTGLDPILVAITSIIIIASVVAALASYQTVKSVKKKRDLELQKLQNKFIDILSLNYLLVVDKKTGLNVYEQFFAGKKIDASLISGFFEAIRNFGIELTGTYTQSQSVKLEYQESKIIMSEFRNFRLIFVMTENPSEDFLTTITNFSYDIDEKFGEFLQDFRGDTTKFRDIRKLVEKNFNVSFIAPLTVRDVSDMKLKDAEIAMINKAKAIMKQNNLNYFFTSFLLPEQTYDPKKTRTIFNLIDKKIFIPTKLT